MKKRATALFVSTLMVLSLTAPGLAAVNPFSDLSPDHWAYEAVVSLAAAGLVEGYPDGTFGGDRLFTRYEMAMVFARILARFENLIDQKIGEGIDARTMELAAEIASTRDELSEKIAANHEELLTAFQALARRVDGLADSPADGQVIYLTEEGALTDEERAVLAQLIADEIEARLAELDSADIQALAERLADLEARLDMQSDELAALVESALTEDDVRRIAELIVADALADTEAQIIAALEAAEGDPDALATLMDARVASLNARMDRMTDEFRSELEQLGVRVDRLEDRVDDLEATSAGHDSRITQAEQDIAAHDQEIESIWTRMGNVRISGKNETVLEFTGIEGTGDPLKDPRDDDSDEYEAGTDFRNTFSLTLTATPAENVEIAATIKAESVFGEDDDVLNTGVDLDVTTAGVLRSLRVGSLDENSVAAGFDRYTLDAEAFGDDRRGANFNLVYGLNDSTSINGFLTRIGHDDLDQAVRDNPQHVFGLATSYTLSEAFDLTFRGVRKGDLSAELENSDNPGWLVDDAVNHPMQTVYGLESSGRLAGLDYGARYYLYNANGEFRVIDEDNDQYDFVSGDFDAQAADFWAELPISKVTARFDYGAIDEAYNPVFMGEFETDDDGDWLAVHLDPELDTVVPGQSEYRLSLSAPIIGAETRVAYGVRKDDVTNSGENTFVQAELTDIEFAGLTTGVLFDRRTDDNEDVDETIRASFGTEIIGTDILASIHRRENEQAWVAATEQEQKHVYVTASRDINLFLPLTLEAAYGSSETAGTDAHAKVGLSLNDYMVGPFSVNAGVSRSQNHIDVDDDEWWRNSAWSNDKVDEALIGFGYTLRGFFGTDIDTTYEHKIVWKNDAVDGKARNTFTAAFEKALRGGEATLAGEGKVVTGGKSDEDGNDTDIIAKLTLTYPIFTGASLELGGEYVSSQGSKADEYTVYHLGAGLTVEF